MSHGNSPFAPPARVSLPIPLHGSTRRIIDEQGVLWKIFERPSGFDRRPGWSLVFESELSVRSVRSYPSDWHSLDAAELIELVCS